MTLRASTIQPLVLATSKRMFAMREADRRAQAQRQTMALMARPDVFEPTSQNPLGQQKLECEHGGRVIDAHLSCFHHDTEGLISEVYNSGAHVDSIVDNWENFLMGQVTRTIRRRAVEAMQPLPDFCETCLRTHVSEIVARMRLELASPALSPGIPPRPVSQRRRSSAGSDGGKPLRVWTLDTLDLQLYVTESYIDLLRRSPASCLEESEAHYLPLYLSFRPRDVAAPVNVSRYLSVHTLALDRESKTILHTPNAGGDSVDSEVLSFEVLKRIMPFWELSTMEMHTRYRCPGPMTDFVARSSLRNEAEVSVSVTRIFGWRSSMHISARDLAPLLIRKLSGLRSATSRILPRRRRGMVLFVWVPDGRVEKNVRKVWQKLRDLDGLYAKSPAAARYRELYGCTFERGLTDNIVLFVAVCKKESWMDLTGYYRVFGKQDKLERDFVANLQRAAENAEARSHRPPTPPYSSAGSSDESVASPKLMPLPRLQRHDSMESVCLSMLT
ncbi:hypothetical protein PYCC9005_004024 [Savitreella phatthalungensis]